MIAALPSKPALGFGPLSTHDSQEAALPLPEHVRRDPSVSAGFAPCQAGGAYAESAVVSEGRSAFSISPRNAPTNLVRHLESEPVSHSPIDLPIEQVPSSGSRQASSACSQIQPDIRMDLHPPELGRIQLQLGFDNGKLVVRLVTETDTAKRLLQSQLDLLRARIKQTGANLGHLDVAGESEVRLAKEPSAQTLQAAPAEPIRRQNTGVRLAVTGPQVDVIA